jgi:hypothetical protein
MPSVKEIYEKITDVTIDADSINLNTDTVESLLSTVQADIALVKTDIANGVLSDLRDGTGNAITSSARGSQRALSVQIVDGSGNQVTTFGSSSVSVSNFPATQPVSGTVSVTDNGGSLTVDGSITATQSTASSLKAQAQLLNAAGTVVEYATTGSAGTPATDVVSVQGVAGGTAIPVSLASVPSHAVTGPLTNTELRATSVPVSLASVPSHAVTGPLTNTELRATAVPISGTVTANTGLTQPLTDTQLRATPVPVRPRNGTLTVTAGSTSASANTSAQALASNASRQYLLIQNVSDTDMYFNFGATATADHLFVAKSGGGIVFESGFVPTDAVNAICSAASKKFYILSS